MQVTRVDPFQRPAGVDPTEHRNFCMAHLAHLRECCINSEPASGTDSHLNSQWSDVMQLPSFDYSPPSRGKFRRDVNTGGKVAAVSRYTSDGASQELPDLETTETVMDSNHNLVSKRKNRLPLSGKNTLPSSSMVAQQKGGLGYFKSSSPSAAEAFAADSDTGFDPWPSVSSSMQADKSQATGRKGAKKGQTGKSSGRGRAGTQRRKQQPGEGPCRKPGHLRQAKNKANSQMKLQFISEPKSDVSDFEDFFALPSSPEHRVTTSYQHYRRHDTKTDSGEPLPLAQRISHPASAFPTYQSSSERSSRLYDAMVKREADAATYKHAGQTVSATEAVQPADELLDEETDTRTRYLSVLRVTTCMENLEMSVILSGGREILGILLKK